MRRRSDKGFAIVTVVFMSMLVAAAATAMMMTLSADARRTMKVRVDAQLQQLLLASQQFAQEQLATSAPADHAEAAMPLPAALAGDAKVSAKAELVSSRFATIHVSASLAGLARNQSLQYERNESGWTLISATLTN
jgi:type II secretory pathway component PulK